MKAVSNILDSFRTIITPATRVAQPERRDRRRGTNALMSDYIREQEKLVWMYSAFLGR